MAGRRMALHFGKLSEMPGRPRQLCQRARSRHSIPRPISSSKETRLSGNGKIMMDPDTVEAEEETKKTGNMTPICLFHQNFWSRQWQGAEASALGRRLSVLLPTYFQDSKGLTVQANQSLVFVGAEEQSSRVQARWFLSFSHGSSTQIFPVADTLLLSRSELYQHYLGRNFLLNKPEYCKRSDY